MRELKKHSEDVSRATGNNTFDLDRLQQLIFLLLDSERDMRPAITCFVRYLRYCDVQYFTIRVLHKAIRELKQQNLEESISKHLSINAASLISSIRLPNLKSADASEQLTRLKYLCETSGFRFKYDMVAKMFTSTCTTFLSFGVKHLPFMFNYV